MLDRALPPALLSLILVASQAAAHPYDFKDNYSKESTPAPEDGPPASYNASRDPNRLPYDIGGVVGGYLLTVLIWGVLLLTIGRRMRRKALEPPKALELELQNKPIKPSIRTAPLASPALSARSASSWLRKFRKSDSTVGSPQSPAIGSPTSFDQQVIDNHNKQAQAEMERLYAAVMDHDEQKHNSKVSFSEMEQRPPRSERKRPSAISTTTADEIPISPIKAIYPPGYQNGPMDRLLDPQQQHPPPSPRSIVSKRSQVSSTSGTKTARFNLKNLRISGPTHKYPGVDSDDEAHTPLSPRFSTSPGAPPSPPTQATSPTTSPSAIHRPLSNTPSTSSPTTKALPLRSFAHPLASPAIQTTVLDRTAAKIPPLNQSPRTAVPFTPYSPYMPFTPITPVTPHLVSRRDRRAAAKVERGRVAALREGLVLSPQEIFGDAY